MDNQDAGAGRGEGARAAVLCSAGLDSAVLIAAEARAHEVLPVYVRVGLAWENAEREALDRLLAAPPFAGRIRAPLTLEMTVSDLYPASHWSLRGAPPAYDTPDEDVYLPGRNVILLSKAAIACAIEGVHRLAIGPLAGNPFPDATPAFFEAMARALTLGLAHDIQIAAPFIELHKSEVIALGVSLGVPLELTLSCMNPTHGIHCGQCSKCRERRDAFDAAGVEDKTEYAAPSPRAPGGPFTPSE